MLKTSVLLGGIGAGPATVIKSRLLAVFRQKGRAFKVASSSAVRLLA
ncbi:hypothetical protein VIA_003464 [Vibrio orientalis CIP 102891 = ATCC 33934]|uniref:Uncharacterized protein n=1 Tax=Vibrio orientalis CIP 102891 = ATCC 33934 TaxID=675816 RepID=A0ABM9YZG3_VIBOR|nr:hypothetical protein VIA_003464 [Vibrio orientalis CIP 102891 = ATCC 33934]